MLLAQHLPTCHCLPGRTQEGDAIGGVRPEGKVEVVEALRRGGAVVAMVGDGVNDAPALAAADVGIALSSGLDAAGQAASVVLMGDRLSQAVEVSACLTPLSRVQMSAPNSSSNGRLPFKSHSSAPHADVITR